MPEFISRAGFKLDHALAALGIDVAGRVCADLGSNVGGFVDCLLQRGAAKVYAVETGYGVLEWKLRKDSRVVVMERTNAMHVTLDESPTFICIDVAWTRQRNILPAARRLLEPAGDIVTLIKPHYEADKSLLRKGVLPVEALEAVMARVKVDIGDAGLSIMGMVPSPILGGRGNVEMLAHLRVVPTTK